VKHFDFNERERGNYEETPMHWVQLRGPGLPILYARGRFDDVGHDAPPSFRLDIQTGNVAYEYQHLDLTVIPESDYFVVGYIRAAGLEFSHAFVAAYFVDRFGERIAGSERISDLVCATGDEPEPWQRVEIAMPGEFPTAHALRLQFWILQAYTWREADPRAVDPIVRRDVYAAAWFDDFSIYRLPRVQLRFSNPAGLVLPGRQEELILEVNNATAQPLHAELRISGVGEQASHVQRLEVPPLSDPVELAPLPLTTSKKPSSDPFSLVMNQQGHTASLHAPVPELAPGFYTAQLRLLGGSETLLERRTHFAVLPGLSGSGRRHPDLGVDLGRWEGGDVAGLRELLTALGCGAVKVGIPMVGPLDSDEKTSYFQQLSTLVRVLAENHIDATGVLLTPSSGGNSADDNSIRELVRRDEIWQQLFSPVLAHFGALLPTWQLGADRIELRDGYLWEAADIERVRQHLRRFITIPRLAIPQPITAVTPAAGDIISVWAPPNVATRALPRQLGFLVEGDPAAYWLQLDTTSRERLTRAQQIDDLARRLILAKALAPARVFLAAPFELSRRGGRRTWQPTEDFVPLRTLFHYLAGKAAVAAMTPAPDTLAIVFDGPEASCLVIWSWRTEPLREPVELYLGSKPRAIDVWGRSVPLTFNEGRTRLPVGPTPLIVEALHTPLALLQASYRIAPTYVQVHDPEPRPVVTFRNPYDTRLSGEVRLTPPGSWQIEPTVCNFLLEPGETFAEPLTLTLPPRQIAEAHKLDVRVTLHAPERGELHFPESLTVGLLNVVLDATVYWHGNDLIVEQSLHNHAEEPVSFSAFCEPPGRARSEGVFLDVAPGELATQQYVFPSCRELAGTRLHMGIQEIDGDRTLNQFAEVPP